MSASKDYLDFMSEQGMSDITISGMTGIPRSTIGFVRRGERSMPTEYRRGLYDDYRKVSYHALSEESLPYHQARRFSSSSPKTVNETMVEMRVLVTQSTRGAITGKLAKLHKQGIIPDLKQIAKDMLAAVKKGFKKSHKSLEQYRDYMFRKTEVKEREEREEAENWEGWFE